MNGISSVRGATAAPIRQDRPEDLTPRSYPEPTADPSTWSRIANVGTAAVMGGIVAAGITGAATLRLSNRPAALLLTAGAGLVGAVGMGIMGFRIGESRALDESRDAIVRSHGTPLLDAARRLVEAHDGDDAGSTVSLDRIEAKPWAGPASETIAWFRIPMTLNPSGGDDYPGADVIAYDRASLMHAADRLGDGDREVDARELAIALDKFDVDDSNTLSPSEAAAALRKHASEVEVLDSRGDGYTTMDVTPPADTLGGLTLREAGYAHAF